MITQHLKNTLNKEKQELLNQNQDNEIMSLRAENEAAKAQLQEMAMLRRKVAEMEVLRGKLVELNSLRAKLAELNSLKEQVAELNTLRSQAAENCNLRSQLAELSTLRAQAAETKELKKNIEDLEGIRQQYEQEITRLRNVNSQTVNYKVSNLNEFSNGENHKFVNENNNEGQELVFEKTVQQITVKGDIIHNTSELEMLTRKINKHNQKLTLNLLYKASADSDKAAAFHEKCDPAQSTLVLVESDKGKRFGGFTTCSWRGDCVDKKDEEAFVFSLDKMLT